MSANLSWIIIYYIQHCIETVPHFHMTLTNIYIQQIKETEPSSCVSCKARISVTAVQVFRSLLLVYLNYSFN